MIVWNENKPLYYTYQEIFTRHKNNFHPLPYGPQGTDAILVGGLKKKAPEGYVEDLMLKVQSFL